MGGSYMGEKGGGSSMASWVVVAWDHLSLWTD